MIRSSRSVVGITVLFVVPVVAAIQQPRGTSQNQKSSPPTFSSIDTQESYVGGAQAPSRRVLSRTEVNGREVVSETIEAPNMDGKFTMLRESTTETVRTATGAQIKRDVFIPGANGGRSLLETTQTEVQTRSDGSGRSDATTFKPDLNGRLRFSIREVQETKVPAANVKQTDTTIFLPGINESLIESERLQKTERKVSADVTQSESTMSLRDGNGAWQTTEARNLEERTSGNQKVAEETIRRLNDSRTALVLSEKIVTTQSTSNGQDQKLIENYSTKTGKLTLDQRTKVTTTSTSGGGQQTVREVEGRRPAAPYEPLVVIERTVETLRQIGPDRWEVERQVFALDGDGRLKPVLTEKGQAKGK